MGYNIVGITPGHNGSISLVSDGELILYLEEERLSKIKHDSEPYKVFTYVLNNYHVDELVIAGTDFHHFSLSYYNNKDPKTTYEILLQKYFPKAQTTFLHDKHHQTHAANAFYSSGFKESIILVVDATGSTVLFNFPFLRNPTKAFEAESIYKVSYPSLFIPIQKNYWSMEDRVYEKGLNIDDALSITKAYEVVTQHFGFTNLEGGKTMGLSSYGNPKNNLPKFFHNKKGNRYIFNTQVEYSGHIDTISCPEFFNPFLKDTLEFSSLEKDMAYNIQKESQELVGDLIDEAINKTGLNNVCITGGYGLNCVANYYMLKRFPNVNFYHDPLSSDAGTSIGAAFYRWHELSPNPKPTKIKTLYNGPKYSKEELLEGIKKYV